MKQILILCVGILIGINTATKLATAQTVPPPINPIEGRNIDLEEGGEKAGTISKSLKLPGAASGGNPGKFLQQKLIPNLTAGFIATTGGLAFLFVIVAGIQILTAYNNEEKITAAKKTLTWALAGLVIAILAYSIVQIIVSINITSTP